MYIYIYREREREKQLLQTKMNNYYLSMECILLFQNLNNNFMIVVLPAPVCPTIPTNEFCLIVKFKFVNRGLFSIYKKKKLS